MGVFFYVPEIEYKNNNYAIPLSWRCVRERK
jgi:hypothetical protein